MTQTQLDRLVEIRAEIEAIVRQSWKELLHLPDDEPVSVTVLWQGKAVGALGQVADSLGGVITTCQVAFELNGEYPPTPKEQS